MDDDKETVLKIIALLFVLFVVWYTLTVYADYREDRLIERIKEEVEFSEYTGNSYHGYY